MKPSARIQAAIEILEGLNASQMPADRFIREFFRARRYAGSKDRGAASERVFDVFRHRASYAWRMKSEEPRALVIASLLAEGMLTSDLETTFDGGKYSPSPLTEAERRAIAESFLAGTPQHVRGEYPQFLDAELKRAFGDRLLGEMTAMQTRAPIDLRVNALKTDRNRAIGALRSAGLDAQPASFANTGVRIPPGAATAALSKGKLFESGAFEFQDEAAQIACVLSGAKPGMRVLDLAAGAGGKALALAALMQNRGEIVARDIAAQRLAQIGPRAERAGVMIVRVELPFSPPGERPGARSKQDAAASPFAPTLSPNGEEGNASFDLVFIDAPCSGSGTWRRQPENKWRLTPARLDELNRTQDALLDEGAAQVKPGGRLLYATCSILPRENEDRVGAFLARHAEFALKPAASVWTGPSVPGLAEFFHATPLTTGTDGFFAAVLERKT